MNPLDTHETKDLVLYEDEWSVQVTLAGSRFFFIRLQKPSKPCEALKFSDFRVDATEVALAVHALGMIEELAQGLSLGTSLEIENICPATLERSQDMELRQREYLIAAIFSAFCQAKGLSASFETFEVTPEKFNVSIKVKAN